MALETKVQKKINDKLTKKGWFVIRLAVTNVSGMPDLLALKKDHKPFFIEAKRTKGGVRSPLQKYYIKLLNKIGFIAMFANSWEVVEEKLKEEGYNG